MRNKEKDAEQMAAAKKDFCEKAYELFSTKSIESVTLQDIANVSSYGIASLYRYFKNKPTLVIEVATWKWGEFIDGIVARLREKESTEVMNSAEHLEFYLDIYLYLYQNHRDMLRFNQFFNIYIQSEKIGPATLKPYQDMIMGLKTRFHDIYAKAEKDHKLRTDITEEEMFSTSLHLMLAAVTRYAVGLAYREGGVDEMRELTMLKEALMKLFSA